MVYGSPLRLQVKVGHNNRLHLVRSFQDENVFEANKSFQELRLRDRHVVKLTQHDLNIFLGVPDFDVKMKAM